MDRTIYLLYATRTVEWVSPLIRSLAQTSDALFIVLKALHLFYKYRQKLSIRFHEEVDRALKAFRSELDSGLGTMDGGTMCAGLFLCTLNVSMQLTVGLLTTRGVHRCPLLWWKQIYVQRHDVIY